MKRLKAKNVLITRNYIKLQKSSKKSEQKAIDKYRGVAKELKTVKYQSKTKTINSTCHRRQIIAMKKELKKCVQKATTVQKKQMKKMMESLSQAGVEIWDDQEDTDSEDDENEAREEKIRRILITQKHQQVNRKAVREFCQAFDDEDVNASRLETQWTKFRKDVAEVYKLNVAKKITCVKDEEKAFVFVEDFDNYLSQIIALEGLPSTAVGENGDQTLWLRIGGDGRSIHRHSNSILIILALMDVSNPRRSHSPLFVHTMMLIDGNESHDLLMNALRPIDDWIFRITSTGFLYEGVLFHVKVVLTGDMKFIQLVKGLQSATSVFSCPLCLKPKLQKIDSCGVRPPGGFRCPCDLDPGSENCIHWNGSGVLRTQQHASFLEQRGGDCWSHLGHHKEAPLKSIQWSMIILDILHALLRITDVIFGSLYEWARKSCDPKDKRMLLMVSEKFDE